MNHPHRNTRNAPAPNPVPPSMRPRLRTLPYLIPPVLLLLLLALWCRSNLPGEFFLVSRAGAVRLAFADAPWTMGLAEADKDHYNPAARLETMRSIAQHQWDFAGIEWIAGPKPRTGPSGSGSA